jgi:hypothetical protein
MGRRIAAGLLSVGLATIGLVISTAAPAAAGRYVTGAPTTSWWYTDSANPGTSYRNSTPDVPIGAWLDSNGNKHISRVYTTFDLSGYAGKHLFAAALSMQETLGSDCADRQFEVWATDGHPADPTWSHAPREVVKLGTIGTSRLCLSYLSLDLTPFVDQLVAANIPLPHQVTLEVRVPSAVEGTVSLGRRLSVGYGGGIAGLTITANTLPDVPTDLSSGTAPCTTSAPYPYLPNLPGNPVNLHARIHDGDVGDSPVGEFAIWPADHPDQQQTFTAGHYGNGVIDSFTVPAGTLTDNTTYAWKVRATDGIDSSAWSGTCYFVPDGTPPAAAPVITSSTYPVQDQGYQGGVPGIFTFSANGVTDVAGYRYMFSGGLPETVPADQIGGSATVSLSPPRTSNTLTVTSYDRAGNISPDSTYRFVVSNTAPVLTVPGTVQAGVPFQIQVAPGPNTGQIVQYTYSVNSGASQTVIPAADGTATIEVTAQADRFNTVSVSSLSANGWVSPLATWQQYVDTAPSVTSSTYPENGDSGGVGVTGMFTLAPRSPSVASYVYSFDNGTAVTVPAATDGTATFDWTPDMDGFHELDVYAVAADGIPSDTYYYFFTVASP